MNKHSAGFTIIEVILFIGVSGLLLVGAFVAMSSGIANTQFNDTTDTTQSYFQKQYFEVATGINSRGADFECTASGSIVYSLGANTTPGSSDCVILGRIFNLQTDSSRITSRYLSARIPGDLGNVDDLGAFSSTGYQVRISNADQLKGEFELPWSAIIKSAKLRDGSTGGLAVQSLAILRSPVSERMMIYAFPSSDPEPSSFVSASNLVSNRKSLIICLQSDDGILAKKALLTVKPGQGQDLFEIDRGSDASSECADPGSPPPSSGGGSPTPPLIIVTPPPSGGGSTEPPPDAEY